MRIWCTWWIRAWRALRRRRWADRLLLCEATLALGFARLLVLAIPLRRMARLLGQPMAETAMIDGVAPPATLSHVAAAVATLSQHLPWRCKCLEQSIAAKLMLRRRGIASTLYLGAARDPSSIEAHAWLRSGKTVLIGAAGRERYIIIASFADV